MRSTNSKANRTFEALACSVQDLSDEQIQEMHVVINDSEDGYDFDFISAVKSFRHLCSR